MSAWSPSSDSGGILEDIGRHPVTSVTVIASIVASLAFWNGYPVEPLFMTPDAFLVQPWRLFTSVLPHGDTLHLVFNVYWTWQFGKCVEGHFGKLRTLGLGALLAAGSSAAQFAFDGPGIGLSGVGYGLFGFLWVLGRRDPAFRGVVDSRLTLLFVGWFFLCIALTRSGTWNVANVAHGAGAGLGVLIGHAQYARPDTSGLWRAAVLSSFVTIWLLGAFVHPKRLLGTESSYELFQRAYAAHDREDYETASELYREVLELDDGDRPATFNFALTLLQLDRFDEALATLDRAWELAPNDVSAPLLKGSALCVLGRHEEALKALDGARRIAPGDPEVRAHIGWTLGAMGRVEEGLSELASVVAREPRYADALGWYGELLLEAGRPEEALEALDRALEVEPDHGLALETRPAALRALEER